MDTIWLLLLLSLTVSSYGIGHNERNDLGAQLAEPNMRNNVTKDVLEKMPYFTNIKKMLKIQVKPAGNMIQLKCKAGGHPTPNITWYKDDKLPTRSLGDIQYHQWSLGLEDLSIDDSGVYKCVVCNKLGCIDYKYTLDVVSRFPSRPSIKNGYPKNVTAAKDSTAVLECPQELGDLEPFIQWIKPKNFSFITNDQTPEGTILETSATLQNPEKLVLQNVTRESEGWYVCVAANGLGMTSRSAYLQVIEDLEDKKEDDTIFWLMVILGNVVVLFVCSIVVVFVILRRLKRKRNKTKTSLSTDTSHVAVVTQENGTSTTPAVKV